MKALYLLGGQQRKIHLPEKKWHHHKKGLILRIDPETNVSEICVEYVTPPEACAAGKNPKILFTAGTLKGKTLYACTQTEVLTYEVPGFERIGYVSLPCFNDLHHVCSTPDGSFLVANTGLDMVVESSPQGFKTLPL